MSTETTICPKCKSLYYGTPESLHWKDGICHHCHDPLKRVNRLVSERPKDISYGWIQWKGTDVCMDVHCKYCVEEFNVFGHIDAEFAYYVRCSCGRVYALNGHIELVEVLKEEEPHLPSTVVDVGHFDDD